MTYAVPYAPHQYAHNRNLTIAIAVSIALHVWAFAWIPWPKTEPLPQTEGPKSTTPIQLSSGQLTARRTQPDQPVSDAEQQATSFTTLQPSDEPTPRLAPPAKRQTAKSSPPKKSIRPIPKPKSRIDADTIISTGLELAASGFADTEFEPGATKAASLNRLTTSPSYASYLASWTRKVERVGRLNYPDKAIADQQEQSLLLNVTLSKDGHVERTDILRSSGNRALDAAAIRIVRLASPFPPFPPEISRSHTRLSITRNWRFAEQGLGIN